VVVVVIWVVVNVIVGRDPRSIWNWTTSFSEDQQGNKQRGHKSDQQFHHSLQGWGGVAGSRGLGLARRGLGFNERSVAVLRELGSIQARFTPTTAQSARNGKL
jgi:hypothetical protein